MSMDLSLLHYVTYGMYVVTARDGGQQGGCIINTCMQITSENPIFAISMNKNNKTHDLILNGKVFALSILSEQTSPSVISSFGFFSSRERNKFEGIRYSVRENGLPILEEDTCISLVFDVIDHVEMETHSVIFGRLNDIVMGTQTDPMSYDYYHKVVKGKAPKNAPTYVAETAAVTSRYTCDVCGYVYEGEELPADFVCPVCGVEASHFEKEEAQAEAGRPTRYACEVCGYVYEGEELPADFVCPVCGVDSSHFEKQTPVIVRQQTKRYVCDVCGYVYEGDSLPEGYTCPVCGVDSTHFQAE
ncbi:rubredoxin-like domain-containing protein [Massiliimalia timonensis]|uniref:rubredoxin-like domain-containing protein n=1 Tax=Massiliimalia timonensis TaxID=1987501 RepID=UPI001E3B760D|nr:flavin reductase [Massiliimalia timonensis]